MNLMSGAEMIANVIEELAAARVEKAHIEDALDALLDLNPESEDDARMFEGVEALAALEPRIAYLEMFQAAYEEARVDAESRQIHNFRREA